MSEAIADPAPADAAPAGATSPFSVAFEVWAISSLISALEPSRGWAFVVIAAVLSLLGVLAAVADPARWAWWMGAVAVVTATTSGSWSSGVFIGGTLALGIALGGGLPIHPVPLPGPSRRGRRWFGWGQVAVSLVLAAEVVVSLGAVGSPVWFLGLVSAVGAAITLVAPGRLRWTALASVVLVGGMATIDWPHGLQIGLAIVIVAFVVTRALVAPDSAWAYTAFVVAATVPVHPWDYWRTLGAAVVALAVAGLSALRLRSTGTAALITWSPVLERRLGAWGAAVVACVDRWWRADPLDDSPPATRPDWWVPVGLWLACQAAVLGIARIAGGSWRSLGQWDTEIFLRIARDGPVYPPAPAQPTVTSFPGYPLLIRLGHALGLQPLAAAVVVSMIAGFAVTLLFWRWMTRMGMSSTARWCGALAFALFPYGFFVFGIAYSDGLFVALAIATLLLVEERHPVWAGVVGATATATRPTGLALIAGALVLQFERSRERRRDDPGGLGRTGGKADAAVVLVASGLVAYSAYCWWKWGDPFAFWTAQAWYGHEAAFAADTWGKTYFVKVFTETGVMSIAERVNTSAQLGLTVAAAATVPAIRKRFGLGYAVFTACVVIQTWIGDSIFSVGGRYLVSGFPVFAAAGILLTRTTAAVRAAVLVVSALLATYLASLFVRSIGLPIW